MSGDQGPPGPPGSTGFMVGHVNSAYAFYVNDITLTVAKDLNIGYFGLKWIHVIAYIIFKSDVLPK